MLQIDRAVEAISFFAFSSNDGSLNDDELSSRASENAPHDEREQCARWTFYNAGQPHLAVLTTNVVAVTRVILEVASIMDSTSGKVKHI